MSAGLPLHAQLINLFAAILLLLSFAMLAQRRVLSLIDLFAAQGLALATSTAIVAYATSQPHLYGSAGLTLVLKVIVLPWLLHRLIRKLAVDGMAVLVISSEPDEMPDLCDRVLIMADGRIVRELAGDDISRASIVSASYSDKAA